TRKIRPAILNKFRIQIGLATIEDPAHARLAIRPDDVVGRRPRRAVGPDERNPTNPVRERSLVAERAITRTAPRAIPLDFEWPEGMFAREITMPEPLVAVDQFGEHVDRGGRSGGGHGVRRGGHR